MVDLNSKLAGLKNAQIFERGSFLNPGTYQLKVEKFVAKDSRKSGDLLIVEFIVEKTTDPTNHPVDSKASWCQKLTDRDVALGAIKEFAYALLGYRWPQDKEDCIKKIDPELDAIVKMMNNGGEALNGKSVCVQTFMKKTNNQRDFTVHRWSPVR